MNVLSELYDFYSRFEGEKGLIGFSHQNRPIPYFLISKSRSPKIIVQYGIHAREYITTLLALEQINGFIKNGTFGSVYFIPAVNPDGIHICQKFKPLYKANARGVDLNVNFEARWGTGKTNVNVCGDENCVGDRPFSEIETQALRDFTLFVQPSATISYHSKGEEIYWEFFQTGKARIRDYDIAKTVERVTGYKVKSVLGSAGGYKDWCIERLNIPALTIEVGNDELKHPLQRECLGDIEMKNRKVIQTVLQKLKG